MKKIKITLLMLVVTSIVPGITQAKVSLHDIAEQIKLPYKHPNVLTQELDEKTQELKTKLEALKKLPNPNLAVAENVIGSGIAGASLTLLYKGYTIGLPAIISGALLALHGIWTCERRNALIDASHKIRLELEEKLQELKGVEKKEAARMQDIIAKLKDMKFE